MIRSFYRDSKKVSNKKMKKLLKIKLLYPTYKTGLKNLLGGKGANLAEMIKIGLPVPPGFTISTEACNEFYKRNKKNPVGLDKQVKSAIQQVEKNYSAPGHR